ncbi:MAG: four helix bundle protein [Anaerolineae bacterium]|nr:four helix bundle protein [Anaerolineae bacterium]
MFKFEKLEVWKRSLTFADEMFKLADGLPQRYQFSISEQLRRAALSIPTNIAEGTGRESGKEQAYFFGIAKGSVYEVVSLLAMVGKRGQLEADDYRLHREEANEIAAMLSGLAKTAHNK